MLVTGPVGSATGLFGGLLQRLGFHVPRPQVTPGDGDQRVESQWVVDFHSRLLARACVQPEDARPNAWAHAAHVTVDESARRELRSWLKGQLGGAEHLAIPDARLAWFLPLWQRCARELRVEARSVVLVCHPGAAVIQRPRAVDDWQEDVGAAAGWLNHTLFTERATRETPRAFVRYDDLIEDWARALDRVAKALGLEAITDAPWTSVLRAQQFLDPAPEPASEATWRALELPAALRRQADEAWELVSRLADDDPDATGLLSDLDAARSAYVSLYEEAEATASSSVWAAGQGRRRAASEPAAVRISRLVPARVRRRVPSGWRRAITRRLGA